MLNEELARTMPVNPSTVNRKMKPKAVVGGLEVKNLDRDHSLSRLEGGAPRTVCGARCSWRHTSYTLHGLEQSLLDMCVGEKRRAVIPSHLAYGKRGFPPSIPADAVLQFDVELIALIRANYWQKLVKGILPLVGMAMVPALLSLIGYHLYKKANRPKVSKKKLKEEKRNKSKKK
ncbi:peptidyl-prolyl cis-trans isomerase FKBP11 isoform X2 [Pteropus medius]|uniref:peptidylprolyl isomerase n=1 Tax=Pteropus vampyrus TaxID=132908 RepID=A0A6P3QP36_PTEVA|nr:peptidyl-prolyl cis-trans isomerase FKBP11 isoform X2 [Pteropus vampyrus]XP_039738089.1 peptidyl-prolyl cis-trans isomerase FKBP11 isoform X2 [Pteropus giganteus]